ncbi:MAG: hypothetical protein PF569_00345 [Candidatus Woesearchaeota archaeon]|jgi:hypothetical protein|nr:hypothetical protein [Candidatus Woesearchaeota archaeon]
MSKGLLNVVNSHINNLNIEIGISKSIATDECSKKALETLKNNMIDVQSKFVKDIEELFYK